MTDRAHNGEYSSIARQQPVLIAGLLAAAATIAVALAADQHWAAGGFAVAASGLFALVRKVPDSNELDVPLPLAGAPRGGRR